MIGITARSTDGGVYHGLGAHRSAAGWFALTHGPRRNAGGLAGRWSGFINPPSPNRPIRLNKPIQSVSF